MDACSSGDVAAVLSLLETAAVEDADHDYDHDVVGDDEEIITSNNIIISDSSNDNHGDSQLSRAQLLAAQQDPITGLSPLMVASQNGHIDICQALLDVGAPWNAVDRHGKCAGDHATDMQHWDVVNLLVDVGTQAEVCRV